jgi:hypothetical protein
VVLETGLLSITFLSFWDPQIYFFLLRADNLLLSQFQDSEFRKSAMDVTDRDIIDALAMPPYRLGESFHETYDVILILDERENFGFANLNLGMSVLEDPLNCLQFNHDFFNLWLDLVSERWSTTLLLNFIYL